MQCSEHSFTTWPEVLSIANSTIDEDHHFGRASWCYGCPGISKELYDVSLIIDNDSMKKIAVNNFVNLSYVPIPALNLVSPTICHGLSGLVNILHIVNSSLNLACIHSRETELLNAINSMRVQGPLLFLKRLIIFIMAFITTPYKNLTTQDC